MSADSSQCCDVVFNKLVLACLKGLFYPACLARVVSWFASVVAIFMGHENDEKKRSAKRRHVQGMLDKTDPLTDSTFAWNLLSIQPCLVFCLFLVLLFARVTK